MDERVMRLNVLPQEIVDRTIAELEKLIQWFHTTAKQYDNASRSEVLHQRLNFALEFIHKLRDVSNDFPWIPDLDGLSLTTHIWPKADDLPPEQRFSDEFRWEHIPDLARADIEALHHYKEALARVFPDAIHGPGGALIVNAGAPAIYAHKLETFGGVLGRAAAILGQAGASMVMRGRRFFLFPEGGSLPSSTESDAGTSMVGGYYTHVGGDHIVFGRYVLGTRDIAIMYRHPDNMLHTAVHELGHAYWHEVLREGDRQRFHAFFAQATGHITAYAATSAEEDFAEAWAFMLLKDRSGARGEFTHSPDAVARFKAFIRSAGHEGLTMPESITEAAVVFDVASIKKLRTDYLMLMRNVGRVDTSEKFEQFRQAVRLFREHLTAIISGDAMDPDAPSRRTPLLNAAENALAAELHDRLGPSWKDGWEYAERLDKRLRSETWPLMSELMGGLPGFHEGLERGAEAGLAVWLRERDKWKARVDRKARDAWTAMDDAVANFSNYFRRSLALEIPHPYAVTIEGVKLIIATRNGELDYPDLWRAALKIFRERVSAVIPWMWQHRLPLTVKYLKVNRAAQFDGSTSTITVNPYDVASAVGAHDPGQLAHTLVHEHGHFLWQKMLSHAATELWTAAVKADETQLDLRHVLAAWPSDVHYLSALIRAERGRNPVLAIQLETIEFLEDARHGRAEDAFDTKEQLQAMIAAGKTHIAVPAHPITGYAATNPQEAFCEALGLLVARGPRSIHPLVMSLLKETIGHELRTEATEPDVDDVPFLFIESDPGLPEGGGNVFAGLDEATAADLLNALDERGAWGAITVPEPQAKRKATADDAAVFHALWARFGSAWTSEIRAKMVREHGKTISHGGARSYFGFFTGTLPPLDWKAHLDPGESPQPINAMIAAKKIVLDIPGIGRVTFELSGAPQRNVSEPLFWNRSQLNFDIRWGIAPEEWDRLDPLPEGKKRTDEGKAVGSATHGQILLRDLVVRNQGAFPSTHRSRIRQASTNAVRGIKPIQAEARRALHSLIGRWWAGGRGAPDYHRVRVESTKIITTAYEQMREIGRKASGIDRHGPGVDPRLLREEEDWYRGAVREELKFWNVFLEEIETGAASNQARVFQRVDAYVDAMRFMYESARILGLPDNVLIYWQGPGPLGEDPHPGDICEGCDYLMERSPFPKSVLPAVPKDGSTACLTNCRHKLVVRVVTNLTEVIQRGHVLPNRKTMIRELKRLKEEKHGTWRRERAKELHSIHTNHAHPEIKRVANPFKGKPAPPPKEPYSFGQLRRR